LPDRDVSIKHVRIKQEWACRTYRCVKKAITVGVEGSKDAEEENFFQPGEISRVAGVRWRAAERPDGVL